MIDVSRTTVPESWLASPIPPKASQPRATQKMITSRFSVSTINTDLFPELVTWATIIDSHPSRPFYQKIPIDVQSKREHDTDTVLQLPQSIGLILDPTSLDFGFDQSCLEGLDDLLAYSPAEAFEEACWAEATYHNSDRISFPTPFPKSSPKKTGRHRRQTRSPLVTSSSSDDSDTDSDDSLTFKEDDVQLDIFSDVDLMGNRLPYKRDDHMYYGDDERTSFMFIEPAFAVPDPKQSVGCFPIPTIPRKSVSSRIAAFCSNLPGSLAIVRSPNAS